MGPRTVVALLCAVNLIAGTAIGVALDRTVLATRGPERHERRFRGRGLDGRGGDRGDRSAREAARLAERLGLEAEQTDKVRAIFAARRPQLDKIMREVQPRFHAVHEQTWTEIRAVLTPEQIARLEALRKEWRRDWEDVARVHSDARSHQGGRERVPGTERDGR